MTQNLSMRERFINALLGTPEQKVSKPVATSDYYEPLAEQVDFLNENQDQLSNYDRAIWQNLGVDKIRQNALEGKNSGLQSVDNAMKNIGLEPNRGTEIIESGVEVIPAKRGFLSDVMGGFKENLTTPYSRENIGQNTGVGYRIGEGLGTLGRIADAPVGRAAIAYGLTKALGGDNAISTMNALTAGITNQRLRTQDQIYRQGLQEQGYDTSNLKGWVTDDLYKNYSNSYYKLRDLQRREETAQVYNELTRLRAQKQAIENSALPELQKAKLIQENAKAQYAAEMQLARIQAYQNTAALGWGRLGLQQAGLDIRRQEAADKREERQAKIDAIRQLTSDSGGSAATPKSDPLGIR